MLENYLSVYFKRFFSGTFLSRISGLMRDLLTAFLFGDHPSLAAFLVAFRFSNLFRRLLGEGPFQSAFIPHFEELRAKKTEHASQFFRQLTFLFILVFFSLILLSEGSLSALQQFGSLSSDNLEILTMCKWIFPGILFICLYGLNLSLLQCHNTFFIPNIAPALFNAVWIALILIYRHQPVQVAMLALSKWLFLGFLGQWLLTLPQTLKHVSAPLKYWVQLKDFSMIKRLTRSYGFGLIGVGAVQINSLADAFFARGADIHGPVYLWNAIRLQLLVLSIFGIALTSTLIPLFSRTLKENQLEKARLLLTHGIKRILSIMIPCTFAVLTLAVPAVNLIFGRGSYLDPAISKTALSLGAYGLGLVSTTMTLLLAAVFFAQGDYKTPMKLSILSVITNLILNSLFVFGFHLGAGSIALATALSSWLNYWMLFKTLSRADWKLPSLFKLQGVIFTGLLASICTLGIDHLLFHSAGLSPFLNGPVHYPHQLLHQLAHFFVLFVGFFGTLLLLAATFKINDLTDVIKELAFKNPADKRSKQPKQSAQTEDHPPV